MPELVEAPPAGGVRDLDRRSRKRVVMLAGVLALDGADLATIGATAGQLERALQITNTEIGLLATVVSLSAALATVPIGVLSDRTRRVPLLAGSVVLWSIAMIVCGASSSYGMLLIARLFLGAVQATSGPTIASLAGDFFPAAERGRIYGYILSGELLGGGIGFFLAGEIAALLSWRFAFWALAVPGLALGWALRRHLAEPARGAMNETRGAEGREPVPRIGFRQAVRYVLSVRTNVLIMIASALGYFFFGGIRTFALLFVRGHYGLTQATATALLVLIGLGALGGVLVAGRVADRMLRAGRVTARLTVAAVAYAAASLLFIGPIISTSLLVAIPLYVLASAALTAPNPPLDAARLDVMPSYLWGRAEGIRTVLRTLSVGLAPLLFGWIADLISPPGKGGLTAVGASAANATGLEWTFVLMLLPVAAGAWVLHRARSSYPRDMARARELEHASPAARARKARVAA